MYICTHLPFNTNDMFSCNVNIFCSFLMFMLIFHFCFLAIATDLTPTCTALCSDVNKTLQSAGLFGRSLFHDDKRRRYNVK